MSPLPAGPVSAVAFDLDGTLYFGDHVADGALEIVEYLEDSGVGVLYFTNNSAKTRAQVVAKLRSMGLPADVANTYTSGSAVGAYLRRRGWGRVAVLGTEGLVAELEAAGIHVVEDASSADALVVGLIPDFDFSHRPAILEGLAADVPIIACNLDMTYPVEGGVRKPGCGAIVAAVEAWTGRRAAAVVGKPGTFMFEALCEEHSLVPAEVLVVGDNVDSDVAMASAAGAPAVLLAEGSGGADALVVKDLPHLLSLMRDGALTLEGARP